MWRLLVLTLCLTCTAAETLRFFVHVPKTGGTTFRHIFAQDCGRVWTFLANAPGTVHDGPLIRALFAENYTCFQGHMSWELVESIRELLPQHNVSTFVLLREPVSRLVSQYYYEQTIFNTNYVPEQFMSMNANIIARYLGANASVVVRQQATHVGLTEWYHETLAYLLATGFLKNYSAVVNYNSRKVHQRQISPDVRDLAVAFTDTDRVIYSEAAARFESELTDVKDSLLFSRALRDLNTYSHTCKNDEAGIGSGKCW